MSEKPIQILMIEDDDEDYFLTRDMLSDAAPRRFRTQRARNLAEGLTLLKEGSFGAVLLDLSLPDSRGLDTFSHVYRTDPKTPIVLLTGLSDETLGVRAVQEGAQDYLVKADLDGRLLVRAILYAIERLRTQEQLARYADELRTKHEQFADDLQMAREVQQAFLPAQYPTFPAGCSPQDSALKLCHLYRPSAEVGGDFFSILPISDTVAGIFICDVMGHGIRAALVTAIIRGLVEELRPQAGDPAYFMTQLNKAIMAVLRQLEQLVFASAVYIVADLTTGVLCCASAGHPRPLILKRDEGVVVPMSPDPGGNGPALGLVADQDYKAFCQKLLPGDAVLLFTDGVFEVAGQDDAREDFGETALLKTVHDLMNKPLHELLDRLVTRIADYSGSPDFDDDICIVAAEMTHLLPDLDSSGWEHP